MAYICGDDGYVVVGVTTLHVTSWEATENAEWSETTNTDSDGYKQSIPCKKSMTGTVNADFDPVLGPKNAPDIDAGDQVVLELHTGATGQYDLTGNIQTVGFSVPAGDKISYTFTFESDGSYSYT